MWDNEPKYTIHSSHGLLFQIFMYLVHLNIPPITPGDGPPWGAGI